MEQAKPKLKINWVQLIGAAGVIAFALASGGADIYNNCVFGFQKSAPIAAIFVLAGVGLMLFPAMAEGWRDAQVWVLVAACAGLSVFAGYQNHMAAQRNFALAEKAVTERYEEAHRAIQAAETAYNEAKAEAASISETMGSKELAQLVSDKRDTIKSECAIRGNRCRKAEEAMEGYGARLAGAKAREEAQGRATKALERMEAEKARAPAQAKAASVTETEELLMAFGLLALTVIGATFTHRAHKLLRGAFSLEQPKTVRGPYKAKQAQAEPSPTPEKVLKGYAGFVALCQPSVVELVSAKDALTAAERWWQATKQTDKLTARGLGMALVKAGFDKDIDRQKRVSYAIKLPAAAPRLVAVA